MRIAQNIKIKLISGIITFFYCLFPIIQYHLSDTINKRFNNHFIFVFSMEPFEFMELIYTNSIIPYLVQTILWLLYWGLLYLIIKLLKYSISQHKNNNG